MSSLKILSTALDVPSWFSRRRHSALGSHQLGDQSQPTSVSEANTTFLGQEDPEFKLPKVSSLAIILITNALLQVSFFIVVSSSSSYAEHLGGTATFSGLAIGIPTFISGLALVPLMKYDQGLYTRPLHFCCGSAILGHILYALAYKANFLYLILIGRMVSGFSFTFFMYSKRYCSDPRIVGVRRRTTLAGFLVVGQVVGFSLGPFLGGLLYRIGFSNSMFNGFTSPGWIMAAVWAIFWLIVALVFEDVPAVSVPSPSSPPEIELVPASTKDEPEPLPAGTESSPESRASSSRSSQANLIRDPDETFKMTAGRWGVTATMCWFAMTCFFILGAWESNIPVFTGSSSPLSPFHFSPTAAGNLIALGGACTFPFLLLNVFLARRYQDRLTLAVGTFLGSAGLFIALAILSTNSVNYASLLISWFLVALGFNLASTVTLSLLSKQLPNKWNARTSLFIQYSNYSGRVTGAVWGGAGVGVGMLGYIGFQVAIVGVGAIMFLTLWRNLKAKTG